MASFALAPFVVAPLTGAAVADQWFLFGVLHADHPWQVWRWLSSHFLHTDPQHLGLNLAALLVLGTLVERHSRPMLLLGFIVGVASVTAWFYAASDSTYYCGMSGVLNALLVLALFVSIWRTPKGVVDDNKDFKQQRRCWFYNTLLLLIGLGALAKNIYELQSGQSLMPATHWPASPGAHVAGFCAGLALLLFLVNTRSGMFSLPKTRSR